MPFSRTPNQSTYQTKNVPIFFTLASRDDSQLKDSLYTNVFLDVIQEKATKENMHIVVSRPGSSLFKTNSGTNVRGMYFWDTTSRWYFCVDDTLYSCLMDGSSVNTLTTFSTSTGDVGFVEFLYISNAIDLIVTDGTTLKKITSSEVVSDCADADLPTPHLTDIHVIDGYLLVVKKDTADIYNSNNDDPFTWTAGDFITAESLPDTINKTTRMNNYYIAFGRKSIEFFWDAGEPSGSPFRRNETPFKTTGYIGGHMQSGNEIYFVGKSDGNSPEVFLLKEFQLTPISSYAVKRSLETTDLSFDIKGHSISYGGHNFYMLVLAECCWVYDTDLHVWYKWKYKGLSTFNINACVTGFNSEFKTLFSISGDPNLYEFNANVFQDNGTSFTCDTITDLEEFGTINQKVINRLSLHADKINASVSVSWSDDDYQTFSTPISVSLNQELPCLRRLGRTRRRAFKISFTGNARFRMRQLEAEINMGVH